MLNNKDNIVKNISYDIWLITDGKIGDIVKLEAIAEYLKHNYGLSYKIITISPDNIHAKLSNFINIKKSDRFGAQKSPFPNYKPKIIIATGNKTIPYILHLKQKFNEKVISVILMKPGRKCNIIDLIWTPEHDKAKGKNIISTLTTPHLVTWEKMLSAYNKLPQRLNDFLNKLDDEKYNNFKVGLIIGGPNKRFSFDDETNENLIRLLTALNSFNHPILISPSRRTTKKTISKIKSLINSNSEFKNSIYLWDLMEENPYLSILAHSQAIIVTADSVNMLSEAVSTGKKIYCFWPKGKPGKFGIFINKLKSKGYLKELSFPLEEYSYEPINSTKYISDNIYKLYEKNSLLKS